LTVFARFTRRGGLDINPLRSSDAAARLPAWQRYTQQ
jgi:NADPH-dependent 7-cyano-7-deazaguanine reductase QueF